MILDAESLFIKNVELINIFNKIYSDKILYANEASENTSLIIKNVIKWFDIQLLKQKIDNISTSYLWFNNLCLYKTEYLEDFFDKTKLLENLKNINFYDFDHYIYMIYLILYKDFAIKETGTTAPFGLSESDKFKIIDTNKFKKFLPYSCNPRLYGHINNKNIFLFIQLDRVSRYLIKYSFFRRLISNFGSF